MRIKSSPFGARENTAISIVDEWTISVDGQTYHFDPANTIDPADDEDTPGPFAYFAPDGPILEAHIESGELFVTVRRFYGPDHAWMWGDSDFLPGGGYRGSTYETAEEFAQYELLLSSNKSTDTVIEGQEVDRRDDATG